MAAPPADDPENAAPDSGAPVEVRAAGGVVWRRGRKAIKVLLVHRPAYDDWTFPKGKLDRGESWRDAARREVWEETGLVVELGDELPHTDYRDGKGRLKRVRYWTMTCTGGDFVPNDEVDVVRWWRVDKARVELTYRRDVAVLDGFARWATAADIADHRDASTRR